MPARGGTTTSEPKKTPAKGPGSSLVDRAYREIKQRILDNFYKPNLQVLEQDLALQLGMSRTPVREAVIRLENEGLVEILPRRGMRVLPISPEDMREIYDVLNCLEALAAQRLAERKPSREELSPLIEAQDDMVRSLDAGDLDAWAKADDRFHRQLLDLAGNKRLAAMALTVFDQAHRVRMTTLRMRPPPHQSNEDHRALLDAVLAGDGPRAHEVHYQHRHRAMLMLIEILKRYDLQEL